MEGLLSTGPTPSTFIGGSESVKVWGVRSILIMWQLVFASCHRLKSKKKKKNKNKGRNGTSHGHPVSYFLPIQAHSSNLELSFSSSRLFGAIRGYSELYNAIWSHLEPFGVIWSHLVPFGTILSYLQPFGSVLRH